MASSASLDRIDLLSCQERHGVVVALERKAYVSGLAGETDYSILFSALTAAGLPAEGSLLGKDGLVLTERNPTVIDKDKCEVILKYENYYNEGQDFDSPPVGAFVGEARASIQQVTTNKDQNGALIEVSHTYPDDDPNYPGETKTQTGEIQVFVPQRSFSVKGIKLTQSPWLIVDNIIGKLNSAAWSQWPARYWICTYAGYRNMDPSTGVNRYFMSFEFQHNPDGWDPSVAFNDENTNRPPPNLVANVGYKTIEYLGEVNFNSVIGTLLQGA